MPTFLRYLLFQIPEWLILILFLSFLVDKDAVSVRATIGLFIVWILKDFVIYPIVRGAYQTGVRTGSEQLVGKKGVAHQTLAPQGYIKIQGELWKARTDNVNRPIAKNSAVRVRSAARMTLLVEQESSEHEKS
ncbi:MAG: NfeD family protein, partial [Candidatus Binatia bacterium]